MFECAPTHFSLELAASKSYAAYPVLWAGSTRYSGYLEM